MATAKVVLSIIAALCIGAFLLFFVPWALNARDSFVNGLGVVAIVGPVVVAIGFVHWILTSNKER